MNLYTSAWSIISTKNQKKFFFIIILFLILSILEIVSIAAVIPFVAALFSPEKLSTFPFLKNFSYYKIGYHIYADKNLTNIPGLKNSKSDIGQRRYEMYISILEKLEKKPNKILLTDSRDVVFQSNIFDHSFKRPLNFFLESEKIMNDPRNVRWLKRTVGQQVFEKIKDNLISCSGTTLGNFEEIMNYIKLMKKNLYLFPYKRPLRHIISLKKVAVLS